MHNRNLLSLFRFWRRLSRFMSKINPEPNLIHIMGCYVLGNPNGEKVQINFHSIQIYLMFCKWWFLAPDPIPKTLAVEQAGGAFTTSKITRRYMLSYGATAALVSVRLKTKSPKTAPLQSTDLPDLDLSPNPFKVVPLFSNAEPLLNIELISTEVGPSYTVTHEYNSSFLITRLINMFKS